MDEEEKVDMGRHQRPYVRGPRARENLEGEFAREFPGETVAGAGEARYAEMERRLSALAARRKAEKEGKS